MNSDIRISRYLFDPIVPLLLYLFLSITTLHMQIPFLLKIHIEFLALIATLFNTTIYLLYKNKEKPYLIHPLYIPSLLGLLFIITPLITSLLNQDQLAALQDEEYKDLVKMILFSICLYFFLTKEQYKNIILNSIVAFYFIFGLYFIYRFLVLHEVREFDQRPLLKIRHGDPNFLCTFFSMMIPIPLLQAWYSKNKKNTLMTVVYMTVSFFFFLCAFLTESRMGLVAIVISMIYLVTRSFFNFPKILILLIFLLLTAISFGINGERVLQRYSDMQDKSNADRYLTWENGFKVFSKNPIFGAGMHKATDSFYQNTHYPPFQSEFSPLDIHNTFLKVAAELGLIGFSIFMLLFIWPWKKCIQNISNDKYFLISSMGILTLSIMTIGLLYKDLFIMHLFVIAGLASSELLATKKPFPINEAAITGSI